MCLYIVCNDKIKQEGREKPGSYRPPPASGASPVGASTAPRQTRCDHGGSSFRRVIPGSGSTAMPLSLQPRGGGGFLLFPFRLPQPPPFGFLVFLSWPAEVGRQPFIKVQSAGVLGGTPRKPTLGRRFGCRVSWGVCAVKTAQ